MNSQFGLANVWAQGDIVTKSVAVLLLLMSLASWMVIIIKTLDLIKYKKIAQEAEAFCHQHLVALQTVVTRDNIPGQVRTG